MTDYLTTDTELTSIANAIRTKGGTSASLTYPAGFVSAINAIPTGGGSSGHTVSIASDFPAVGTAQGPWLTKTQPTVSSQETDTSIEASQGETVYIVISSNFREALDAAQILDGQGNVFTSTDGSVYGKVYRRFTMPSSCVTVYPVQTKVHTVTDVNDDSTILSVLGNENPMQPTGLCAVGSLVFIISPSSDSTVSTTPDVEPWQFFDSEIGYIWAFTMPDSDVAVEVTE